jgi:hypothetical protein
VGPNDKPGTNTSAIGPWDKALFGRSHDSGWYTNYLVPFGKSMEIAMADPAATSYFWYMCRGVENMPRVVAGPTLPPSPPLRDSS